VEWKVKYERVRLRRGVQGRQAGVEREARDDGPAATIKLSADRTAIDAMARCRRDQGGMLDNEGRSVPTADDLIHFKVTGEGTLIGVGNGDPNCQESDKDSKRSLFNGLGRPLCRPRNRRA